MHNTDTDITLVEQLRIYDGDELIFDGSDPSTYTICETAEQLEAAFAAAGAAGAARGRGTNRRVDAGHVAPRDLPSIRAEVPEFS